MHLFTKQPSEIIPVEVDFQYIVNSTETITTLTVTAVDSAGTSVTSTIVGDTSISGDICKAILKAGTDGSRYKATFKATTNEGNVYEEDVFMKVYEI